jgi:hypothetical protein
VVLLEFHAQCAGEAVRGQPEFEEQPRVRGVVEVDLVGQPIGQRVGMVDP